MPQSIEFVHAELPKDLVERLQRAREVSSAEVSPKAKAVRGNVSLDE